MGVDKADVLVLSNLDLVSLDNDVVLCRCAVKDGRAENGGICVEADGIPVFFVSLRVRLFISL